MSKLLIRYYNFVSRVSAKTFQNIQTADNFNKINLFQDFKVKVR